MTATFSSLRALDAQLVRAGHHPLTDRWSSTLEAFYEHSTAKTLVAQVGRGGAKSHTAVKIALNEALNGDWNVPPGEIHFFAFVSASKEEAQQRLLLIQSFLNALKLPHETSGDTIHLNGKRVGFRVFAQSVAAVSGFRCIGFAADELAKWRSASTAKNPAAEVVTSMAAMTITHPNARALLISSPWSTQTYHYKRVQQGDTSQQLVITAPSWVMNPTGITERAARAKSDSEAHFRREYLAVASTSLEDGFFSEETIARCIDSGRSHIGIAVHGSRYFCAVDPAFSAKGDLFGCAVVTSEPGKLDPLYQTRAGRITTAVEVHGWRATGEATPMIQKLKSDVLSRYEVSKVYSDRFEGFSFRDLARAHGVNVEVFTSEGEDTTTVSRYKAVRTAMMDAAFRIPEDERLINEFRAVASELSAASGNELIRLPKLEDGSHCDRVSALILAGSIALSKPAHLPVARMSRIEQMERAANQRKLSAMFTGGL